MWPFRVKMPASLKSRQSLNQTAGTKMLWKKFTLSHLYPLGLVPDLAMVSKSKNDKIIMLLLTHAGRRLAELEMHVLLSKTLMKYQMTTDVKDIKVTQKVILKPDTPLQIKFHPRT